MNFSNTQKGSGQLVMVLVVATILTLLLLSVQIIAFILTKQSAQSVFSQQALFAAEGSMFESVQFLKDNPTWPPSLPFTDTYQIDDTTITRTVNTATSSPGTISIEIVSDSKGARRKLVGAYREPTLGSTTQDIMLLIDRSSSMNRRIINNPSLSSIKAAKDAALLFVDTIQALSADAQIGVVAYDAGVTTVHDLSGDLASVRTAIQSISTGSGTNIGIGLQQATKILDDAARPQTQKAIVLLSDGYVNRSPSCGGCSTGSCLNVGSNLQPDDIGTCCSHDAINLAQNAKTQPIFGETQPRNYQIYSVFLENNQFPTCSQNQVDRAQFARLTLLRISSQTPGVPLPSTGTEYPFYKETIDANQLQEIYKGFANSITQQSAFTYFEALPN